MAWQRQCHQCSLLSDRDASHPGQIMPLGDISLALETLQREAVEQEKSFDDHLHHLVIHGMLHVLGFDHETAQEAEEMETLEISILAAIGISNPYIGSDLILDEKD